jgi:hypothetical protein
MFRAIRSTEVVRRSDGVTGMFIFHRSIAGPLVALTLLALLVAADAQFDSGSTPGTKAIDIAPSGNAKFGSEVVAMRHEPRK